MSFPLDPNAPGGPRRSEYVRRSLAGTRAPSEAHADDAEVTVRDGEVVADPGYRTGGIMALLHLRRLEARIIMSIFGA